MHVPHQIQSLLGTHTKTVFQTSNLRGNMSVANVAHQMKLMSRLPQTFFGLSDDYMKAVYEEFFILKYHGGWSFFEAYNLPIGLRRWFLQRLGKQFEEEKKQMEQARKSAKSR